MENGKQKSAQVADYMLIPSYSPHDSNERTNEWGLVVLLNDLIMMTRYENMEKTPGKETRKLDPCTKRYKKKEIRRTGWYIVGVVTQPLV